MSTHAGNILTIHSPEGPRVSNRQRQEVVDGVDESSAAEGHFQLEASPAKSSLLPILFIQLLPVHRSWNRYFSLVRQLPPVIRPQEQQRDDVYDVGNPQAEGVHGCCLE